MKTRSYQEYLKDVKVLLLSAMTTAKQHQRKLTISYKGIGINWEIEISPDYVVITQEDEGCKRSLALTEQEFVEILDNLQSKFYYVLFPVIPLPTLIEIGIGDLGSSREAKRVFEIESTFVNK